jgi:hypothetical protein
MVPGLLAFGPVAAYSIVEEHVVKLAVRKQREREGARILISPSKACTQRT